MKFSEMPYARPDLNELKQQLQSLTDQLKAAPDYAAAREAFLAQQKLSMHINTLATLSSVRNSIDTRDKFYDAEEEFWNEAGPELRAYDDAWTAAMLESPFRKEFAGLAIQLRYLPRLRRGRRIFAAWPCGKWGTYHHQEFFRGEHTCNMTAFWRSDFLTASIWATLHF